MYPILVTAQDACKRIGVCPTTFNKMRKAGSIPPQIPGTNRYSWPQIEAALGAAPPAGTARQGKPARRKALQPA